MTDLKLRENVWRGSWYRRNILLLFEYKWDMPSLLLAQGILQNASSLCTYSTSNCSRPTMRQAFVGPPFQGRTSGILLLTEYYLSLLNLVLLLTWQKFALSYCHVAQLRYSHVSYECEWHRIWVDNSQKKNWTGPQKLKTIWKKCSAPELIKKIQL